MILKILTLFLKLCKHLMLNQSILTDSHEHFYCFLFQEYKKGLLYKLPCYFSLLLLTYIIIMLIVIATHSFL